MGQLPLQRPPLQHEPRAQQCPELHCSGLFLMPAPALEFPFPSGSAISWAGMRQRVWLEGHLFHLTEGAPSALRP